MSALRTKALALMGLAAAVAALLAAPAARADVTMTLNLPSSVRACADLAARGDVSDAAVAACDRALAQRIPDMQLRQAMLLNRGITHARRNEAEAALADFDAVIAMNEEHAEAWLNRGVTLMMLDNFGPAVVAFTEALSLGVQEPHLAYYNRAAAREALNDLRGAYEDYSTALEIAPDWGQADAERRRVAQRRQEWLGEILVSQNQSQSR
jgi:tetratricopeptide (TPR) repeat protein